MKGSYFVHEEVYDNRHRPEVAALGEARPAWLWVQHGDAPPRPLEDKDVLDQEHASTHVAVLNALLNHESNASSGNFARPLRGVNSLYTMYAAWFEENKASITAEQFVHVCLRYLGWTRKHHIPRSMKC